MAQVSDTTLANQGFPAFRAELNSILGALNSMHVGTSAPSSLVAGSMWVDSGTSGFLKIKINDGTDNIELMSINISTNAVTSAMSVTGTVTESDPNALPLAIALG
jgi:hypothetical protein